MMKHKDFFIKLPGSLKQSFLISLCFFIVLYLVFVSIPPSEQGAIPSMVSSIITSNEYYEELSTLSQAPSQERVIENAQGYTEYYWLVIITIFTAFLAGVAIILFVGTVFWNLIIFQKFSLKSFWRLTILYIIIGLVVVPIFGGLSLLIIFLSSAINSLIDPVGTFFLVIANILLVLVTLHIVILTSYYVVKIRSIRKAIIYSWTITKKTYLQYIYSYVGMFLIFLTLSGVSLLVRYQTSIAMIVVMLSITASLAWVTTIQKHIDSLYSKTKPKKSRK